ncbi:hypothetical protein P171DRAFT_426231 [Karstenula rhodostoma CBS 690.94]|uniref:Uncharacterized protein n=1 Tax=Karstenula rhodostoma CBS 690.94 TaxID=1392251 RepID=A0A9P4PX03_9PLEO|nr:hypothetical protein P171DRAFT_426231 [Karstenula rhodostoma CBS 690.94]
MAHGAYAYSPLDSPHNAGTETEPTSQPSRPYYLRYWRIATCAMLLSSLAVGGLFATLSRTQTTFNCGTSIEEARALGCQFDVMSFTWSHPSCFDRPLMDDFLALKNWTWWLRNSTSPDSSGDTPLSIEDITTGQYTELHVTWDYHLHHCTYMWRKMHRAILNNKPLDGYIGNWAHTTHCESMLLDRSRAMDSRTTIIRRKFPDCPGRGGNTFIG